MSYIYYTCFYFRSHKLIANPNYEHHRDVPNIFMENPPTLSGRITLIADKDYIWVSKLIKYIEKTSKAMPIHN